MNLEWNVYRENCNNRTIEKFNIFNHYRFAEDVKKALKKTEDKNEFAEIIKRDLQYYFWSKCEYEIVLTSWVPRIDKTELERLNQSFKEDTEKYGHEPASMWVSPNIAKKVDIYEQVAMNFDAFVNYVWSQKGAYAKQRRNKNGLAE